MVEKQYSKRSGVSILWIEQKNVNLQNESTQSAKQNEEKQFHIYNVDLKINRRKDSLAAKEQHVDLEQPFNQQQ